MLASLRTKFLLPTFYVFFRVISKNVKVMFFLKSEKKRKIRILEHCFQGTHYIRRIARSSLRYHICLGSYSACTNFFSVGGRSSNQSYYDVGYECFQSSHVDHLSRQFLARDSICYIALYAIARPSVRPSVRHMDGSVEDC